MAYRDSEVGRAADRERFRKRTAARRPAGCCTRCGGPVHDGFSRYAPCIAFAKLDRDRVEIVKDAPVAASYTSWS